MGKPTGFIEIQRELPQRRPVPERVHDWNEVYHPFPVEKVEAARTPQVPALLKGYLRSGAWICGAPAWDPDFESADLFVMMPLANLDGRYARHYNVAA